MNLIKTLKIDNKDICNSIRKTKFLIEIIEFVFNEKV